jgi:serine/threonine protein kinase
MAAHDPPVGSHNILLQAGFLSYEIHEQGFFPMRWLQVDQPIRDQGWKLHLSTRSDELEPFLGRIAPILRRAGQPFKLLATAEAVSRLNGGEEGATQVGKVVTIYPNSDDTAVEMGSYLATVLSGWPGPTIDNEIRIARNSPVYARYGGFRSKSRLTKIGLSIPTLIAPDGESVPDMRTIATYQALGIANPFPEALEPSNSPLIGNRYLAVGLLAQTRRHKLLIGVDIDTGLVGVLKVAKRHAAIDSAGRDSAQRLGAEWALMNQLKHIARIASPMAFVERDDDVVLITERIDGPNLLQARSASAMGSQVLADIILQMFRLVQAFHAEHLVFGDISPTNFVLADDGFLYGVDLELSRRPGDSSTSRAGTPGFASPEVLSGRPYSYDDDLYSLAANVYFLTTGINLSALPKAHLALARRDMVPDNWVPVIDTLLSGPDTSTDDSLSAAIRTVRTLRDVEFSAKENARRESQIHSAQLASENNYSHHDVEDWKRLSAALGVAVASIADWRSAGLGVWNSQHPTSRGESSRTFYSGDSGIAYGLLRIGLTTEDLSLVEVSIAAAERLWRFRGSIHDKLPGLIVGETGVGLLFLTLYEILGEATWLDRAVELSRDVRRLEAESPDLLHGIAGQGLFYTWLFSYTSDAGQLEAAKSIARRLGNVRETSDFGPAWRLPDGYGGLSGQIYLGMAHGTAGVGFFLAELLRIAADDWEGSLMSEVTASLTSAVTDSASGPDLGVHPQSPWQSGAWCHGSPGIALALLHASRAMRDPALLDIARKGIEHAISRASRQGPTQCHGLAGTIEVLLEAFSVTGDSRYFTEACRLGDRLATYFVVDTAAGPFMCSEHPEVLTPEFMVGTIGCAAVLARLCNPEQFRHFLMCPKEAFHRASP